MCLFTAFIHNNLIRKAKLPDGKNRRVHVENMAASLARNHADHIAAFKIKHGVDHVIPNPVSVHDFYASLIGK